MCKMNIFFFLIFLLYFNGTSCESGICNFKRCGECISATEGCIWCSDFNVGEQCKPASYATNSSWCLKEFIEKPEFKFRLLQDDPFGSVDKHDESHKDVLTQFRPQHVYAAADRSRPVEIKMSYKPAQHYPLDVYFLMDKSYTMINHLKELQYQAYDIYKALTNLTNNVRMGVGSFIDKPIMPYADPFQSVSPHYSYVFQNEIPITKNWKLFEKNLKSSLTGSNYDNPEAGLEALMQVMACGRDVNWRNNSRKIIVLCTDNTYHSAGDGKMLGIIKLNDMKCHLENNVYTMETEQDYPSVSQINEIATAGGFQIIFAIQEFLIEYTALANQIMGAKYAALSGKESNILSIIKESYKEAQSSVTLYYEAPEHIELTMSPDCTKDSKNTKGCHSSIEHQIVDIKATIKVKYCPKVDKKDSSLTNKITIGVVGLADKLIIDLNTNCHCKCEDEPPGEEVPNCHNAGYLQCGLCQCNAHSFGNNCQCNVTSDTRAHENSCKKDPHSAVCSGIGDCMCGKCENCKEGFSGNFCEFDNNSCPRRNKRLCSNNGICEFPGCHCFKKWTGEDCSCPVDNDDCIEPGSSIVCSGHGRCNCGVCECYQVEGKNGSYSGVFCDNRCLELEDYVYCRYLDHEDCDKEYNITDSRIVKFLNTTAINEPEWKTSKLCQKIVDDQSYMFRYKYEENKLILAIQREPPPKANLWVAMGSAIGAVVLIGLLTAIIWKIVIDIHDAKEYNKFAEQSAAAGFDVSLNPLYASPALNFVNPVFNNEDYELRNH